MNRPGDWGGTPHWRRAGRYGPGPFAPKKKRSGMCGLIAVALLAVLVAVAALVEWSL